MSTTIHRSRLFLLTIVCVVCILGMYACAASTPTVTHTEIDSSPAPTLVTSQCLSIVDSLRECEPPCWIGMTPGVTEKSEAENVLAQYYGADKIYRNTDIFLAWKSGSASDSLDGVVTLNDNVIESIDLSFNTKILTAQQLVDVIGDPGYVEMLFSAPDGQTCWVARLLYPDMKTIAEFVPDQTVTRVDETQSGTKLRFLSEEQDLGPQSFGAGSWVVEWSGYRDYCALRS
jgi:hypothetical protein